MVGCADSPIFLVGFMGCGKTTVGKQLADQLGWAFADTDQLVEQRTGKSIAEIYRESGEAAFRSEESAVLATLADSSRMVVATGGGLFGVRAARRLMQATGRTVWLDLGFETTMLRVGEGTERPLWRTGDPTAMRALFDRRRAVYALADLKIAVENRGVEDISKCIRDHFR
jgi:shikimate kinase